MNKSKALTRTIFVLEIILEVVCGIANFMAGVLTCITSNTDEMNNDTNWISEDEDLLSLRYEEDSVEVVFKYLGYILLKSLSIIYLIAMIIVFGVLYLILKGPIIAYLSKVISYSFNILSAISAIVVILLAVSYIDGGEKEFLEGIEYLKTAGIIEFCKSNIKNTLNI